MPSLISAANVRAVYPTSRDDAEIQEFIDIAVAFTDARLATAGLSTAVQKEIQRYFTAHLLFVTDAGVHQSLRTEDVAETFTGTRSGLGLSSSRWGATVLELDSSGTLISIGLTRLPAELRLISREDT